MKVILLTLIMSFFLLAGEACTMCNSKQATGVRALVFGDDFYKNLFFTILPLLIFIGLAFIRTGSNDDVATNIS